MPTDHSDLTGPHQPEPDVTLVKPVGQQFVAASPWIAVPGYEIECELKRGGMGVVYRAKQTGLNRVVALKMILAGSYADPATRARFLLEAESVAALEHSHVVKVFAFGEHAGHPYLAMEFLPGGTLADRTKTGPLPVREATEYVAKLAAAAAHAHSRGIVHRDIKPANVLLTAEGEPRLADFGLAKVGRADQHLSVTGQALGTPSYMAPEQAAGKTSEVGTAADVYALGAVLYDLLTGRPPFRGDSVAVTLQKVISEEPERPRTVNASVPRDLETICLKCLEKAPDKRYPTAQALTDDLRRFLSDEPISARPAGALERGYKWVKRNKVVAGAVAAVALALLTGTGVSLGFGLAAEKRKKEADDAAERANTARLKADAATATAEREKQDAIGARNEAMLNLAEAVLGPISAGERLRTLTEHEAEALWRLARLCRTEVPVMFLREATRTPLALKQLECRTEYVFQTALGLDAGRRDAADRILLDRLRESPNAADAVALARACSRWGETSPTLAAEAADVLIAALGRETNLNLRHDAVTALSLLAPRMERTSAAEKCKRTSDVLLQSLPASNSQGRSNLVRDFLSVAVWMEPSEAEAAHNLAAVVLLDALEKELDPTYRLGLAGDLVGVSRSRLIKPAFAADLGRALKREKHTGVRGYLADALRAVTPRMGAPEAERALLAGLDGETDRYTRRSLAEGLSEATQRSEPARAVRVLESALKKETNDSARNELARGLSEVARRADPPTAAAVLRDALSAETDFSARRALVQGLMVAAARLEPAQATGLLTKALATETRPEVRERLVEVVSGVIGPRSPTEAADLLLTTLEKEKEFKDKELDILRALVRGLTLAAERMSPPEAAEKCTRAAVVLRAELARGTRYVNAESARGLAVLTAWMEPTKAVHALFDGLKEESDLFVRSVLVRALAVAALKLTPTQAADVCTKTAGVLLPLLEKAVEKDFRASCVLSHDLAAIAPRIEPNRAEGVCFRAADAMLGALGREVGPSERRDLAEGFAALVARVKPERASKMCDRAVDILIRALNPKFTSGRPEVARGLAAVVTQMDPDRAVGVLVAALGTETSYDTRAALAAGLATVATRMNLARAADVLLDALKKERDSDARNALAVGLSVVIPKLEPSRSAEKYGAVAQVLIDALAQETNLSWYRLPNGLLAVVRQMEPAQGAQARVWAAQVLLAKITTKSGTFPGSLGNSYRIFRVVVSGLTEEQHSRRGAELVGTFATSALLPSVAMLPRCLQPQPLPLGELVNLLKHPFCVGEARRAVLDELEFTYNRPFKNQWEFVEFAQKHHPELDLLTPPERPAQP